MTGYVIGDEETATPFELAGFRGVIVSSSEEMYKKLLEVSEEENVALIVLSGEFASEIRQRIDELRAREDFPPTCEVPSATAAEAKPVDFKELLKRALGVSV